MRLLIFLLLSLIASSNLYGQKGANTFTCATWDDIDYPEIFYRKGKELKPLELVKKRRSSILPLGPDSVFELYTPTESIKGFTTQRYWSLPSNYGS